VTRPFQITLTVTAEPEAQMLAPLGFDTPQSRVTGLTVTGGTRLPDVTEAKTGQTVALIRPEAESVTLTYAFDPCDAAYPEAIWQVHDSRFTRAAEALVAEARATAPDAPPAERARAIACATAERFTYGHPETRFTDGLDHVPHLGCGLTAGSCVDINTYFLAALRAAGIEASYVVGYFFPAEKGDWCNDAHCWVVTRTEEVVQHWDIAHYLKLGTRDIYPALNPKPGFRAPVGFGMGLDFPQFGVEDLKLLSEPIWLCTSGARRVHTQCIRLRHPEIAPAAAE